MVLERKPFMFTTDKISCNFHYDKIKQHWWFIYNKHLCIKINIHVFSFQNVACFTVNGRLTNLSWYPWENHSCLQLIKCHVTSIMSKSNDIDGLFIITIYVIGQNVACFTVNGRFKNLSWYLRENHSCLQLKGYHVTSTVTKLNDIDGLSIITIYVFK